MSTQFYRVTDGDRLLWLGGFVEGRGLWVWVPNTAAWHRHRSLEIDFLADGELTYERVDASEAAAVQRTIPRVDERTLGWLIDEMRNQPEQDKLTSVEIGIRAGDHPRPTRLVADLLVKGEVDTWVVVKTYPRESDAAARQYVSRAKRGLIKALSDAVGPVDARSVPRGDELEVEVRRLTSA